MGLISQKFMHPALGRVNLKALAAGRRVIARYRDNTYFITVPAVMTAQQFERYVIDNLDRLRQLAVSNPVLYHDGYTFENDKIAIAVAERPSVAAGVVRVARDSDLPSRRFVLETAPGYASMDDMQLPVRHIIERLSEYVFPELLDEMRAVTASLGLAGRVRGYEMMRGKITLGQCTAARVIKLSRRLVFYPRDMRHSVMTHELAHLDEMNHSEAFYRRWSRLSGLPVAELRGMRRRYASVSLPFVV